MSKRKKLIKELSEVSLEINEKKKNNSSKDEIEQLIQHKRYLENQLSQTKSWQETLPKIVNFLLNIFGSFFGIGTIFVNGFTIEKFIIAIILLLNFWGYYLIFTENY